MNQHLVSDRPVATSLLGLFALFFLGFVVIGPALGVAAATLVYDGDVLTAMTDPLHHPGIRNAIILSQGIASLVGLILLPWAYLRFLEKRQLQSFFKPEKKVVLVFLMLTLSVVALGITISPVVEWNANIQFPSWMGGFGDWAKETEDLAAQVITMITENMSPAMLAVTLIVIALIPGIGEELVFRGLIQNEVYRATKNPHVSIWLTAAVFSAFHLQFFGFVPRVLLGAFLGYIYFWSGNLWVPILGHFLNNGLQLLGLYFYQHGILNYNVEETSSAPWLVVLLFVPVMIGSLYYIRNYFISQTAEPA